MQSTERNFDLVASFSTSPLVIEMFWLEQDCTQERKKCPTAPLRATSDFMDLLCIHLQCFFSRLEAGSPAQPGSRAVPDLHRAAAGLCTPGATVPPVGGGDQKMQPRQI